MSNQITKAELKKIVHGLRAEFKDVARFSAVNDRFWVSCAPLRTLPPNFHLQYNPVASRILGRDIAMDYIDVIDGPE